MKSTWPPCSDFPTLCSPKNSPRRTAALDTGIRTYGWKTRTMMPLRHRGTQTSIPRSGDIPGKGPHQLCKSHHLLPWKRQCIGSGTQGLCSAVPERPEGNTGGSPGSRGRSPGNPPPHGFPAPRWSETHMGTLPLHKKADALVNSTPWKGHGCRQRPRTGSGRPFMSIAT